MTVPGVVGASKRQQGSPQRRNLGGVILDIPPRAQHTQLAVRVIPFFIEIHQHGDDLALVIGVDIAVGPLTEFAHGNRGGQGGQVHIKARAERRCEGGRPQLLHQRPERRPVLQVFQLVVGGGFNRRVVGVDPRQHLGAQKPGHNHIIEGIGMQFGLLDRFEIDQRHRGILVGARNTGKARGESIVLIVRQIDVNSAGNRHRTADAATGLLL